ncbi:MAG: HAMP domain-containing histidine kinase [Clostridiales bacterium]|nr:HAMP domain-containing histidine kinase [Clostridiales bacterium]
MKLKNKIIIAFFILITMPIIMICVAGGTIVNFQMHSIQETYDVESDTMEVITNPIQIFNRLTRGVYNEIKLVALKAPEKLEDESYIKNLNEEIQNKYSFITVRKNGQYIYSGNSRKLNLIANSLPAFGVYDTNVDGGIYVGGKNPFLLKAQDFYFSDGGEGTIFVITDLNVLVPQIKAVVIQSIVSFLIIICFTALVLMLWIYRSIVRPLNILRFATNQIGEGDLDYSVSFQSNDEIGQLCYDFEKMRIRLKELIDDRLRYEEDIKELVSNISHDLKTPLTAIKGYAEGLMDGVADTPQKQDKYLKTICAKANDMSVLVDELAFYAKIDCNTVPYSFTEINLHEYFDDCIEELTLDLEVKNIEIVFKNEVDPTVLIMADAEQLKRVINNIIGNSVKYLDKKKGTIRILISDQKENVLIAIEDNGRGIADQDIPYIFDRFYRADSSRNTKKGGSGLGLAIAKKIIEDHSGQIWAKSEQGRGTTIFFTLRKVKKDMEQYSYKGALGNE